MIRALALLAIVLSGNAWAGDFLPMPWRSDTWFAEPDSVRLLTIFGAALVPVLLAVACLRSKERRERRLGALLAVLMLVSWGEYAHLTGTVWFVRPLGGSYGSENGTSYANAWDGTVSVLYDVSHVTTGDTLIACGEFAEQDGSTGAVISIEAPGAKVTGNCTAYGGPAKAVLNGSGTLNYGMLCYTAAQCLGQTWSDFTIKNFITRGLYIRNDLSDTVPVNFAAHDIDISDILGTDVGPQAIAGWGSNWRLYNITTMRSSDDSVHWQGDGGLVEENTFYYPAYNVTTDVGDCVQVIAQADNTIIRRNKCYHTNSSTKQCWIITGDESLTTGDPLGGTDDNAEISNNECYYPTVAGGISTITKPIYSSVPNTKIFGNFVIGGYFGIYLMGAGSSAIGNVLVGQINRGIDTVDTTTTGTKTVANNTVIGAAVEAFHIGGNGSSVNVWNNVAAASAIGFKKNATPTVTQSNNVGANNTTDSAGSFGSVTAVTNPGFVGGLSPATPEGACLKPDSPLLGAGTFIAPYMFGYGKESLANPPPIGARGLCQKRAASAARRASGARP